MVDEVSGRIFKMSQNDHPSKFFFLYNYMHSNIVVITITLCVNICQLLAADVMFFLIKTDTYIPVVTSILNF